MCFFANILTQSFLSTYWFSSCFSPCVKALTSGLVPGQGVSSLDCHLKSNNRILETIVDQLAI